jgi:hypothetical protein
VHVPEQRTLHRLRPLQHSLALASEDPFRIASHSGLLSCSPLAPPRSPFSTFSVALSQPHLHLPASLLLFLVAATTSVASEATPDHLLAPPHLPRLTRYYRATTPSARAFLVLRLHSHCQLAPSHWHEGIVDTSLPVYCRSLHSSFSIAYHGYVEPPDTA